MLAKDALAQRWGMSQGSVAGEARLLNLHSRSQSNCPPGMWGKALISCVGAIGCTLLRCAALS